MSNPFGASEFYSLTIPSTTWQPSRFACPFPWSDQECWTEEECIDTIGEHLRVHLF